MTLDINVIYKIILVDKVRLYKEFTDNKTMIGVGLVDRIITAYKYNNKYYDGQDKEVLGRLMKFLSEYHDEPSNKRHILYNV